MTIIPIETKGSMRDIFDEIVRERIAQDEKWGGASHDDTHSDVEWVTFIQKHSNLSVSNRTNFKKQMVRVAALAVAAIQSYDRKTERQRAEKGQAEEREI